MIRLVIVGAKFQVRVDDRIKDRVKNRLKIKVKICEFKNL